MQLLLFTGGTLPLLWGHLPHPSLASSLGPPGIVISASHGWVTPSDKGSEAIQETE